MIVRFVLFAAMIGFVSVATLAQRPDTSPHTSNFVTVNGIRLHYLDWGGNGENLLFLTGAGDTAHVFDAIAPRFTDRFRVLALTRRGFGDSDKPESGYDVPTLTDDVNGFLNALKIKRVNLVGHSAGGNEMISFAGRWPKRTVKLVFLDAAYDRRDILAISYKDPLEMPESAKLYSEMSARERIERDFFGYMDLFNPNFRAIRAPTLSFYAIFEKHWAMKPEMSDDLKKKAQAFIEEHVRPYQMRSIARLHKEMPQAQVELVRNSDHYFFRDPKKFEEIVQKMRRFLLDEK